MSVFLAIDLDEPTRAAAKRLSDSASGLVRASWVRPEKFHCTLVFLGTPAADQIQQLTPSITRAAAAHRPFSIHLAGAGTFSTARAASVAWLGVGGALEALAALQADLASALLVHDLPGRERDDVARAYVPHVTLARAKSADAFDDVMPLMSRATSAPMQVTTVTLFESRHDAYRPLFAAKLAQP